MYNTLTNLCIALLNFSLFCLVLYGSASVQYCNAMPCINLSEYWTTLMRQVGVTTIGKVFVQKSWIKKTKKTLLT